MGSNMTILFPGIPLSLEYVPRSFKILGFEITVFGLLLAVSLIIALIIITTVAKRRGISPNQCLGGAFFAIIGGIVGSRALYVGLNWSEYGLDWIRILNTRDGGMTFFGAIAGSMLFLGLFSLMSGSSFLENADVIAIGGCFCQAVARWGDFFNREAFGEYTELPFAMQLPLESVHSQYVTDLMRENLVDQGGTTFIQAIPLFLFESAAFLILFFILTARNRRKLFEGETFYRYLTWCGFLSIPIRFLRTDKLPVPGMEPFRIMGTEVDLNLIIPACMFVLFGLVLWVRRSMAKKRSDVRREHNERIYQQEEQAEEADKREEEQRNDLNRRTEEIRQARYRAEEENRFRTDRPDRRGSTSVEEILAEAEALRAEADSLTAKAAALSSEKSSEGASEGRSRRSSKRDGRRSSGNEAQRQDAAPGNAAEPYREPLAADAPRQNAGADRVMQEAEKDNIAESTAGNLTGAGNLLRNDTEKSAGDAISSDAPDDFAYPWSKWETEKTRRAKRPSSDAYETMFTDGQTMEEAEKGVTLDPTMKIDID